MQETEYSVLNKIYFLNIRWKIFIIFSFFSFIFLFISLLLIPLTSYFILAGVLLGITSLYISFFLIELLFFIYKNRKASKVFSFLIYFIRIFIFSISFFILLTINFFYNEKKGVELLLEPINFVSFFITYIFYIWAVYFLPIFNLILKKFIDKNISKKNIKNNKR